MIINLKHPKYMLPIIALPFLAIAFYAFGSMTEKNVTDIEATKLDTMKGKGAYNSDLPEVANSIAQKSLDDKFALAANMYKEQTTSSGIEQLKEEEPSKPEINQIYTDEEARNMEARKQLLELQNKMKESQILMSQEIDQTTRQQQYIAAASAPSKQRGNREDILSIVHQANKQAQSMDMDNVPQEKEVDPMLMFRDQMRIVDSMQKESERRTTGSADPRTLFKLNQPPGERPKVEEPLSVSSTKLNNTSAFTTVLKATDIPPEEQVLRAVIDEDGKVFAGSRLRFRLLQPIQVGKYFIPKNTYVYGNVVGFQTQRVNIKIEEILWNNLHLPVNIDIFDQDGYLGLYVPGSNFREFTREIGTQSSQGMGSVQIIDQGTESLKASLIKQLFTSGSNSISKLISQQKANIKYNYFVILKPKHL